MGRLVKRLTQEMVVMKTKTDRLDKIKNLNFWGSDLCDISLLRGMPCLEVLSLSVNHVQSLRDLECCHQLSELYLRKNEVSDLTEVCHLRGLTQLKVLWLSDNPVASHPRYRDFVVSQIPSLEKLDQQEVTAMERAAAAEIDVNEIAYSFDGAISSLHEAAASPDRGKKSEDMNLQDFTDSPSPNRHRYIQDVRLEFPDTTSPDRRRLSNDAMLAKLAEAQSPDQPQSCNNVRRSEFGVPRRSQSFWSLQEEAEMCNTPCNAREQKRKRDLQVGTADNVLCAVLALIKELDSDGLELARRAVEQQQFAKSHQPSPTHSK